MPFYTYMLHCSDKSYYVGHTDNLSQRLSAHQLGTIDGYTAARLPVKLVWHQEFHTREDAFNAERKIKGWSRKKKQALIESNWEQISFYSKKNQEEALESFDKLRTGATKEISIELENNKRSDSKFKQ